MSGKKMEGDENQRRKAREARDRGRSPSAEQVTTGASKQRHHVERHADHEEKAGSIRKGKQPVISNARPKPPR